MPSRSEMPKSFSRCFFVQHLVESLECFIFFLFFDNRHLKVRNLLMEVEIDFWLHSGAHLDWASFQHFFLSQNAYEWKNVFNFFLGTPKLEWNLSGNETVLSVIVACKLLINAMWNKWHSARFPTKSMKPLKNLSMQTTIIEFVMECFLFHITFAFLVPQKSNHINRSKT